MPATAPTRPAADFEAAIHAGRIEPGMTFNQRAWALITRIPAGKVATYGTVAAALGSPSARAVGQAMARNPYAPRVPCHRVVGGDGRLTGYSADGGTAKKRRMLIEEGVAMTGLYADRVDLDAAALNAEQLAAAPATPIR